MLKLTFPIVRIIGIIIKFRRLIIVIVCRRPIWCWLITIRFLVFVFIFFFDIVQCRTTNNFTRRISMKSRQILNEEWKINENKVYTYCCSLTLLSFSILLTMTSLYNLMTSLLSSEIGRKVLVDRGVIRTLRYVNKLTGTGRRENGKTAYKDKRDHFNCLHFKWVFIPKRGTTIL